MSLMTVPSTLAPRLKPLSQLLAPTLHPRFRDDARLAEVYAGSRQLKIGDRGEGVRRVQEALGDMGFYAGDRYDGSFGPQTATALRNFQSSRSLPQTGRLDLRTMQSLNQVIPAVGLKLWQDPQTSRDGALPSNRLADGRRARAVVDLSEHRLFLYKPGSDELSKVYSIASGNANHPDGKGLRTPAGVKVVIGKNNAPAAMASLLWPETEGRAFGTRLLDLSAQDASGKVRASGIELHGTFARASIGTDASHGCMRMLNEDIEEVFDTLKNGDRILVQE